VALRSSTTLWGSQVPLAEGKPETKPAERPGQIHWQATTHYCSNLARQEREHLPWRQTCLIALLTPYCCPRSSEAITRLQWQCPVRVVKQLAKVGHSPRDGRCGCLTSILMQHRSFRFSRIRFRTMVFKVMNQTGMARRDDSLWKVTDRQVCYPFTNLNVQHSPKT
jgi:hypothetical protein